MTKRELKELARKSQDPEILDQLSRDEHKIVRFEVAMNPNASIGILDQLSRDEDEFVRLMVTTKNPKWKAMRETGLLDVARLASKWLEII